MSASAPDSTHLEWLRKQAKDLLKATQNGDAEALSRLAKHHPRPDKQDICLADAQLVVAREWNFPSWARMKAALRPRTLSDEVRRVQARLVADGKQEFLPLLTEDRIKEAIRKGAASYLADRSPERPPGGGTDYFREVIVPLFDGIVQSGAWPENAWLDVYYEQTPDDKGVTYDGIGVSLEMRTPGQNTKGFSHSILDVWYGRF